MKKVRHYLPELIVLVYAILFLVTKQPSNPWDRMIATDGKGYYSYLPALFIYGDTDFGFIEQYESLYYPPGGELFKDFRFDTGEGIVNKYFPGIAILWLPFFLLAHAVAYIAGFPPDGYSLPYQLAIGLAALFYFWLSLHLLRRILRFYANSEIIIAWSLAGVALGTNLIYYTINAPSQVHVYNFFLITAFIYSILAACRTHERKLVFTSAFLLGMIIISRPQNGLIVLSLPFLCGSRIGFTQFLKHVFLNARTLMGSVLFLVIPLLVPVSFWLLATGQPLIYTYGNESYNLLKPNLFLFLFSFEKGWMLYTPIAAFSAIGFLQLFKKSKWESISLGAFLFFIVYFLSSWWVWNYTSYISQRVMIDFYTFLAILLVNVFLVAQNKTLRTIFSFVIVLFVALNIFQYFQQLKWIYPAGPVTATTYLRNFFSLTKEHTIYIPATDITAKQEFNLEGKSPQSFSISSPLFYKDEQHKDCIVFLPDANDKLLFSRKAQLGNDSSSYVVKLSAWYYANKADSAIHINTSFGKLGRMYSVNRQNLISSLSNRKWTYIETALYMPYLRYENDSVFISIANVTGDSIFLDQVKVEFLKMKDSFKHQWISSAPDDVQSSRHFKTDFETELQKPWGNKISVTNSKAYMGKGSSIVNSMQPYSVSFELDLDTSFASPDGYFKIKSNVLLESDSKMSLVFDFSAHGKTVFYRSYPVTLLNDQQDWFLFEVARELPIKYLKADKVKIYFWYQSGLQNAYIDNFEVEKVFYKKARLIPSINSKLDGQSIASAIECENFDSPTPLASGFIQASAYALSGKQVCVCNRLNPFSFSHKVSLRNNAMQLQSVHVKAQVLSDVYKTNSVLVVDFQLNGKSVSYVPIYLNASTHKGNWVAIDRLVAFPKDAATADSILVYIYSPSGDEELLIDDFCVQLIHRK